VTTRLLSPATIGIIAGAHPAAIYLAPRHGKTNRQMFDEHDRRIEEALRSCPHLPQGDKY
jgi:gas vesicle protein